MGWAEGDVYAQGQLARRTRGGRPISQIFCGPLDLSPLGLPVVTGVGSQGQANWPVNAKNVPFRWWGIAGFHSRAQVARRQKYRQVGSELCKCAVLALRLGIIRGYNVSMTAGVAGAGA